MKITLEGTATFSVGQESGKVEINNRLVDIIWTPIADGHYLGRAGTNQYRLELIEQDPATKTTSLKINGKLVKAVTQTQLDLLLESMGLGGKAAKKAKDLKSPMPGLVVSIAVEVGQSVQKGDPLLVLEAMKMENTIKADGDGVVTAIKVSTKQAVDKGQVLIQF